MTQVVVRPDNRFRSIAKVDKLVLPAIVLVALAIRLVLIIALHTYDFPSEREMGYEMGFLAESLANGRGFAIDERPSVWMAPLYPFVLSLVFRAFGSYTTSAMIAALALQSIVSAVTVVPLYLIAKRLFDQKAAIISGLLWAFHPGAINYAVRRIWSSSFAALGLTLIVLLCLRLRDRRLHTPEAILCGLVIGLTALTNPVILAFAPFALLWLVWHTGSNRRRAITQGGIVSLTAVAVLIPWTIRNYIVFDQFVLIKGTFGVNLWQGNNPYVVEVGAGIRPLQTLSEHLSEQEVAVLASLSEVEFSNALQKMAWDFISNNPDRFASYTLRRIYLFWTIGFRDQGAPAGRAILLLSTAFWGLRALTLLGIGLSWRRWRETSLLLLLLITYPVVYYLTIADTYRYRFPIEGLMLVFAAYSIAYWLHIGSVHLRRALST